MKNIDNMRVGDFLHLLDCMQEECCCYKTCNGCRYNEICECDISNIETIAMKETVKSYAKMNGLLEHMHYVNDQKWISVNDRLPEDGESVLTYKNGNVDVQVYEKNRNGWIQGNWFWSMATVTHWMPLPEYKGETENVD